MAKKAKAKAAKPKKSAAKAHRGAPKKAGRKGAARSASRKTASAQPAAKKASARSATSSPAGARAGGIKKTGGTKKAAPTKAEAKKAAATKAAAKKAAPKKAAPTKAEAKKAAAKKAAPNKPSRTVAKADHDHDHDGHEHDHDGHEHDHDGHDHDHDHVHEVAWHEVAGKTMIIQIVGDAEAYFFDFAKLDPQRRGELVEHHLAAWDHRQRAAGKSDWTEHFVPFALVGESIPPSVRGRLDLSAPHEGLLLYHAASGAVLYAASKDDEKLAILAPDLDSLSTTESDITEVVDPTDQSYAYAVDRAISQGFTLGQIEELMQTMGASLTMV